MNSTHNKLFPTILNTKVDKSSCGRPRAQTQSEQSQVRYQAALKRKLVPIGSSQQNWKLIPAKAKHKGDCEFKNMSRRFTKILRHGGCHEADGAVRWAHVLSILEDAEQSQKRDKQPRIDLLSRSVDKPREEYCEDQIRTIIFIRAVQGHSHGASINPNLFSLKEIPLNWTEHISHTGSSSNYKSIQENGLWAGGLSLRSTRQACFFSPLSPQESSSRQRAIDWKGLEDEPRMVLY